MPAAVGDIQVNGCCNTLCDQYGVAPSELEAPVGRRTFAGYTRTGGIGTRMLSCQACKQPSMLKSNMATADELKRLGDYLVGDSVIVCKNELCATHDNNGVASFHRFGTTPSGAARVRCKTCGKTQSYSSDPTWKQKVSDKNDLIFSLLINKVPMRRILEVAGIGAQTLYRKLEYFERQCLRFAATHERELPSHSFEHLDISTDRQDYLINWGSHINRRSFVIRAVATSERKSGFVFGIHPNFDPQIGVVEIEKMARDCGDTEKEVHLRQHARLWLLSDYVKNAQFRNDGAVRRSLDGKLMHQPARAELITQADPFSDEYEHTAPARGVQVRQEYVLMAHFLFLRDQLKRAKRLALFMDPDVGLRNAAIVGFQSRIKNGEVDVFLVRSEKGLSVDKRDLSIARSEQRLTRFMATHGHDKRWDGGVAWLEKEFSAALKTGSNPTAWIAHPFSDRAEPGKEICLLTVKKDSQAKQLAKTSATAGLKSVDRFFMLIRRRISLLERPIKTPASAARTCYVYSPYNPAVACQVLNIFRVVYNYHLGGEKDKATPAMRLGLTRKRYSLSDILATTRPTKLENRETHSVVVS